MKGRQRVIRELREKAKEHVIRGPKGLQKGGKGFFLIRCRKNSKEKEELKISVNLIRRGPW